MRTTRYALPTHASHVYSNGICILEHAHSNPTGSPAGLIRAPPPVVIDRRSMTLMNVGQVEPRPVGDCPAHTMLKRISLSSHSLLPH